MGIMLYYIMNTLKIYKIKHEFNETVLGLYHWKLLTYVRKKGMHYCIHNSSLLKINWWYEKELISQEMLSKVDPLFWNILDLLYLFLFCVLILKDLGLGIVSDKQDADTCYWISFLFDLTRKFVLQTLWCSHQVHVIAIILYLSIEFIYFFFSIALPKTCAAKQLYKLIILFWVHPALWNIIYLKMRSILPPPQPSIRV